jgi:hypothetical protein
MRRSGKLVIVNLQKTPLDKKADLVIHATCDTVMQTLMTALEVPVPPFKLARHVLVSTKARPEAIDVTVQGLASFVCLMSIAVIVSHFRRRG